EFPEINVIGEAANAKEGLEKIDTLMPDLIFLDVQMPDQSGFDMLTELDRAPQVIFVTAFHEFAVKAFEVNALDYLMKPVEPRRRADAIHKLHQQSEERETSNNHRQLLSENDQVFVKDGERCWFVKLSEVRLFESVGNYAK